MSLGSRELLSDVSKDGLSGDPGAEAFEAVRFMEDEFGLATVDVSTLLAFVSRC